MDKATSSGPFGNDKNGCVDDDGDDDDDVWRNMIDKSGKENRIAMATYRGPFRTSIGGELDDDVKRTTRREGGG